MTLVNDGIKTIAGVMGGDGDIPTHVAIGTGDTAATTGDTTLETETDRNALSSVDTSVAKDVTYIADYSAAELNGTTMTEFGLFNASSAGSMFMREVISATTFTGDLELQIQATMRFSISGT